MQYREISRDIGINREISREIGRYREKSCLGEILLTSAGDRELTPEIGSLPLMSGGLESINYPSLYLKSPQVNSPCDRHKSPGELRWIERPLKSLKSTHLNPTHQLKQKAN